MILATYIYVFIMNLLAFLLYGVDKARARKQKWRIPEKTLLLVAVLGGSIGAFAGMRFFHHKTKHFIFCFGVPAIIIIQATVVALLVKAHLLPGL